jgi:hypothetical protein
VFPKRWNFSNRWTELGAVMGDIQRTLDQLERRAEKMETILMIREPSSTAAGEAYEGLRKQVVSAVSERLTHLAQLVQLDSALAHGADHRVLRDLVGSWLEQASLVRIRDPEHPQRDTVYELVEDAGGPFEVVDPAYVDAVTNRVIRLGRARRAPLPEPEPEPEPEPVPFARPTDGADTVDAGVVSVAGSLSIPVSMEERP